MEKKKLTATKGRGKSASGGWDAARDPYNVAVERIKTVNEMDEDKLNWLIGMRYEAGLIPELIAKATYLPLAIVNLIVSAKEEDE